MTYVIEEKCIKCKTTYCVSDPRRYSVVVFEDVWIHLAL